MSAPLSPAEYEQLALRIAARRSPEADEVVSRVATRIAYQFDCAVEEIERELEWRRMAYRRAA